MSENPEGTSLARRISSVAGVEHQGELRPSRDLRRSQDVEYVPTHVARSHRRSFLQDDGDKKVAPGPIKEHRISFDKKAFGKDPDKDDEHAKLPWNKRFVIHPLGMFRFFWDIGMTALVVYVAIMTPVRLALFWSEFDEESLSNSPWLISELIIDIVFLLDIVLNFFTVDALVSTLQSNWFGAAGIYSDQEQIAILDLKRVIPNYLRTWFIIDLVSSFPYAAFDDREADFSNLPKVLRILRVIRLLKLLRVSRGVRYLRRHFDFFQMLTFSMQRVIMLFIVWLFYAHVNACIQILIPTAAGLPSNSWIVIAQLENASKFKLYSFGLFRALSQSICIGYGIPVSGPEILGELWMVMISMGIGAAMYAIFFGVVATLLIRNDAAFAQYTSKVDLLNKYMASTRLPLDLRERIRNNYEHTFKKRAVLDEDEALRDMPHHLRSELALALCGDLLRSTPIFEDCSESLLVAIAVKLRSMIVLEGDYIIHEDEVGDTMYFIKDGAVDVEANSGVATVLEAPSYFGEIALLQEVRRTASVRARRDSELYMLNRESFNQVMQCFPEAYTALQSLATFRLKNLTLRRQQLEREKEEVTTDEERRKKEEELEQVKLMVKRLCDKLRKQQNPNAAASEVQPRETTLDLEKWGYSDRAGQEGADGKLSLLAEEDKEENESDEFNSHDDGHRRGEQE